MSIESSLVALLQGVCANTYPDVAPEGATPPYLIWQGLGGSAFRYSDGPADVREPLIQVTAWSETRAQSNALIQSVAAVLWASASLQINEQGDILSTVDPDTGLRGAVQRFTVFGGR